VDKLLRIGQAAALLGVCAATLRRWEREGKIAPDLRTAGGERRYSIYSLASFRYPLGGTPDQDFMAATARTRLLDLARVFDEARTEAARNE
jgi:hypothetical protein